MKDPAPVPSTPLPTTVGVRGIKLGLDGAVEDITIATPAGRPTATTCHGAGPADQVDDPSLERQELAPGPASLDIWSDARADLTDPATVNVAATYIAFVFLTTSRDGDPLDLRFRGGGRPVHGDAAFFSSDPETGRITDLDPRWDPLWAELRCTIGRTTGERLRALVTLIDTL